MTRTRFEHDRDHVPPEPAAQDLPTGLGDAATGEPSLTGQAPSESRWRPVGRSTVARLLTAAAVAVAVLLAAVVIAHPFGDGAPEGGTQSRIRIVYQALPVNGQPPIADDMAAIARRVYWRLVPRGDESQPPTVSVEEPDRIVIGCPDAECAERVRRVAGVTGRLALIPLESTSVQVGQVLDVNQFPPLITGDQVTSTSLSAGADLSWSGELNLTAEARQLFDEYTSAHVGGQLAITIDGAVVATPTINRPVSSGIVSISSGRPGDLSSGGLSPDDAQTLFSIISSRELPYPLREVSGP